MKFGLNVVPIHPHKLGALAVKAEQLGFESLWVSEHVIVPYEASSGYPDGKPPFKPDSHFVEPFTTMAHLAALTSAIRLGTGVAIFPLRSPIHLARVIATVDVLSGGRINLGIGVGWLKDEFDIVGQPWDHRGDRLDECLTILDRLFNEEKPEFHGQFYEFSAVGFQPKPVQRPHPPFLIGGSPVALRRAARVGDGWYGGMPNPGDAAAVVKRLRDMRADMGREGPFEITALTAWGQGFDHELVEAYAEAGVDRLVVTPWPRSSQASPGVEAFVEKAGLGST